MRHLKVGRLASRLRQGGFIGLGMAGSGPAFVGSGNSPAAGVRSLFANGEAGAIFIAQKPSEWGANPDLVTMYQDAAGTTPVTALEQPVGLHLDTRPIFKFPGGAPNPAPNAVGQPLRGADTKNLGAPFQIGASTAATYNTSTGAGTATRVDASNRSTVRVSGLSPNTYYAVSVTCLGGSALPANIRDGTSNVITVVGIGATVTAIISSQAGGLVEVDSQGVGTTQFTINSIKAVYGNHRSQSSAGARGTLSARYNKVTARNANPVDLTNVTKSGDAAAVLSIVSDSISLAAAGLSALCSSGIVYKLDNSAGVADAFATIGGATGTLNTQSFSVYARGSGTGQLRFNVGASPVALGLGIAYTRTAGTGASANTTDSLQIRLLAGGVAFFILPDLREACYSYLPTPQLILSTGATAADYDDTGFPARIKYSGAQGYATAAVDFSGAGAAQTWLGVAKLSDAAFAVFAELTANAGTTDGGFGILLPNSVAPNYASFLLRGTVAGNSRVSQAASLAAPAAVVLQSAFDTNGALSSDQVSVRANGSVLALTAGSTTTAGPLANSALNFGSRGGTGASSPAIVDEFVSIVRGGLLAANDSRIAQAEQFCNNLMSKVF